jgi:signal transduction histidine kinase
MTIVYKDYHLQIGKTPLILIKEILSAQWIFILTGGILVVIVSMFLTHRFAGPMYRFEKSLEEMLKGHFDFVVHLRQKDEGKDIARMMNQLIDMVSLNFKEMRQLNSEIQNTLTGVSQSVRQGENEKGLEDLNKAGALVRKLDEILHNFKIKNDT